jgi:hypothetical protein
MDRVTKQMTSEQISERTLMKSLYVEAIRDWVTHGSASEYALAAAQVQSRTRIPDATVGEAHAHFRLAQILLAGGNPSEAAEHFAAASRLHPDSWAIWRQAAEKDASGLAATQAFWDRVDALGDRPYHLPIDMKGMPGAE